jgi:hypothetical protein
LDEGASLVHGASWFDRVVSQQVDVSDDVERPNARQATEALDQRLARAIEAG